MTPEMKTTWLNALRSDRYEQGRLHLKKDGCYCCLGVLCDIADPDGWRPEEDEGPGVETHKLGWVNELGDEGRSHFGISGASESHLVSMNDGGQSFAEIADWIEANL